MVEDCVDLPYGSRLRQICEGRSELPLRRVNAYRDEYGLPPLAVEDILPTASKSTPQVRMRATPPGEQPPRKCCGGAKQEPKPNGTGPGSQLLKMLSAAGAPTCDACLALAGRMDQWGPTHCRKNIGNIVADMLPRAIAWEREKVGWLAAWIPEAITEAAVRLVVTRAIDSTPPQPVNPPKVRRRAVGKTNAPTRPPSEVIDLANATRHLTFHIWPVKGFRAWQWNCDRLLKAAPLFNGRRIVSIVTDSQSDSADEVKDYLKDFTDEFIVLKNNAKLREVVTWLPMLDRLKEYAGPSDVTFSAHAKCVRHKTTEENKGSTIFRWTEAMWEACSRWDIVRPLLESHGTVGAFRQFGGLKGFGPWHFTGTFFWWRNREAFQRDWRKVPQAFMGTEAWIGMLFEPHEAAVMIADNVDNLYVMKYWEAEIEPQLQRWRAEHAQGVV